MPIPKTRDELLNLIEMEFKKLDIELRNVDTQLANEICVDDWTIKDLLAVRLWWTKNVLNWVEKGKRGVALVLPTIGFSWKETPRLNREIISNASDRSFISIVTALRRQHSRLLIVIESLSDIELLEVGIFRWAGKYPVSRWLSINTARQYHTAQALIRRTKNTRG